MSTRAAQVLEAARAKGVRIVTIESCTGGMISAALTDIAGASDVFERGFVTYSNAAKIAAVGVKADTLEAFGAVSPEVAREMALGGLAHAQAQLALSVTGVAGPGASAHKPEGRVCFGRAFGENCDVFSVDFGALGRTKVRDAACAYALDLMLDVLKP